MPGRRSETVVEIEPPNAETADSEQQEGEKDREQVALREKGDHAPGFGRIAASGGIGHTMMMMAAGRDRMVMVAKQLMPIRPRGHRAQPQHQGPRSDRDKATQNRQAMVGEDGHATAKRLAS